MIDTETIVKLARRGSIIMEVGVTHLPRTAGAGSGAKPMVVLRALREVWRMYPRLSRLDPGRPPAFAEPTIEPSLRLEPSRQEATL